MTHFIGTAGDDTITGTKKADYFDMSQGGDDTVYGMGGKDVFYFGAAFTAGDHIDGGTRGKTHEVLATLELNGDYSAGVVFGAGTMVNVSTIKLDAGHSYNLTINQATVNFTTDFTVDASALGAGDSVVFDGSADTSFGRLKIVSRAGHVELTGSSDTLIDLGSTFNAGDKIVGTGHVEVDLSGDYSAGMTLSASVMTNVSILNFGNGTYNFTTTDDLVAAGQQFDVFALNGIATVTFDGSAETDGNFDFGNLTGTITGGAGNDFFSYCNGVLTSGGGDDDFTQCSGVFHLELSSKVEIVNMLVGNNTFYMGGALNASDEIIASGSNNTVILDGDYSQGVAPNLNDIQLMQFVAGHSYDITAFSGVAKGATMIVDGSALGAGDSLVFDGSAERGGKFTMTGGAGDDTLTGGQSGNTMSGGGGQDTITGSSGNDTITGGGGHDVLNGGSNGNDVFVYGAVTDSTGIHFDTVVGFDVTRDAFDVMGTVSGIDAAITAGKLDDSSSGKFNKELAAAVDAADLAAGHAVLFTPDSGSLAGDTFLVIDQNGIAGYQANADLVIEITGSGNIASLALHNFM